MAAVFWARTVTSFPASRRLPETKALVWVWMTFRAMAPAILKPIPAKPAPTPAEAATVIALIVALSTAWMLIFPVRASMPLSQLEI